MLEEAFKALGPWPLIQLLGGLAFLYVAIISAKKGKNDPAALPAPPAKLEIPDWFMDDFKAVQKDVQRILWIVEDFRNQTGLFKSSDREHTPGRRDSDRA